MKIDWKQLSKSDGYKSLKKSYIYSVSNNGTSKEEARHKLDWAISRAKHYSHVLGISLSDVLGAWEHDRTYCMFNYYQEYKWPRLKKESVRRSHEAKIRSLLSSRAGKG